MYQSAAVKRTTVCEDEVTLGDRSISENRYGNLTTQ